MSEVIYNKGCYSCIYLKSEFYLKNGRVTKSVDTCTKDKHNIKDKEKGCNNYIELKLPKR